MTYDNDDVKRLQNDVEREIISLKALIPDPRMLEILVDMGIDPSEEEEEWAKIALNTAKRIREHNSCSIHDWPEHSRCVS